MKYLVIGDANSMHIYNFVKTVLLPKRFEVHLLTLSILPIRREYREFYHEKKVVVHAVEEKGYKNVDKKDRLHRLLNLWRKLRLMADVPYVDICHVQSVYKTSLIMVLGNRRKYGKLILSYWGGDIEDRSPSLIKLREKCFRLADAITVTVEQTYREFQEIYGEQFNSKLRICRFATDGLSCIHLLAGQMTRQQCRDNYAIPADKIVITCGYSAYAAQHQDQCLEIIDTLDEDIKKRLVVMVPMQYGRFDMSYIERVKFIAERSNLDVRILEEFVPFEKSVQLAISTDIYLHLRDTDAFSNALKEHVYSSSSIIKGDWLHYPELTDMGAEMRSIVSFDELKQALNEVISQVQISEEIKLFDPIYRLYSTEAIVEQWSNVVNGVIVK